MKRYLLFTIDSYYADGGWEDFDCDYDDLEEAKTKAKMFIPSFCSPGSGRIHIVDIEIGKIIYEHHIER